MLYNYNQNHYSDDEREVTGPGEQLDHAIERVTRDANVLVICWAIRLTTSPNGTS